MEVEIGNGEGFMARNNKASKIPTIRRSKCCKINMKDSPMWTDLLKIGHIYLRGKVKTNLVLDEYLVI
jgi:hypothetical protein